eukprot:CAMPEP_0185771528 /NCGR_PEP_ID=MMETSP1174-20130828/64355_1 /TAXON_ID=35687 /ORGANISM="Dictyocha speculum, Strain CCMP1381" /LENGTH=441 /DNA_ID=CAMNT_0028457413 /DNA_START=20 /DNA_END=1345 /DNA_ORIENTATION=+
MDKNKGPPPGGYPTKPKLSKKERRELQEKQRAAKESAKNEKGTPPKSERSTTSNALTQKDKPDRRASKVSDGDTRSESKQNAELVQIFAHLAPFKDPTANWNVQDDKSNRAKDPAPAVIMTLGLRYADGSIRGGNARCLAMLEAMKQVVSDFRTAPDKTLKWDLDKKLKASFQFLTDCRPHSISMGNAFKFVRRVVFNLELDLSDDEARAHVVDEINDFIGQRITLAGEIISSTARAKINDGDVILTYGRSAVVEQLLIAARKEGKAFSVIVVDARPHLEGATLLGRLTERGIKCTYVLINAVSYAMVNVAKVILGAAAVMANGAAISRVGTSIVAMVAASRNVPVIVCCETYKLSERVQLDSIVHNELGDPHDLVSCSLDSPPLLGWRDETRLKLVNLRYDLTPMKYVGMIITEVGMIPPTAVPALLREYRREDGPPVLT